MTLKEALKEYYSAVPAFQFLSNTRLAYDMRKPAWQDDIVLRAIADLCFYYDDRQVHPDMVVTICNSIGMTTVEKLLVLMQNAKDTGFDLRGLLNYLHPELNKRYFSQIINNVDLKKYIHTVMPETNQLLPGPIGHRDDMVYMRDTDNLLIPWDKIDYVWDLDPSDRFSWVAESRDCDDAQGRTKTWLGNQKLGNITSGFIDAALYRDNIFKISHAFEMAVGIKTDGSLGIRFGDPQNKKIRFNLGEEPTFSGVNRMTPFRIVM